MVVCEVAVDGVVAGVVTVTVVVAPVAAAVVELFELPQAASASARHGASRIADRRMVWVSVPGLGLLPFPVAGACDHCGE